MPARRPLLAGADATRALDAAASILAAGLPFIAGRDDLFPMAGSCGAVVLADALVRARREPHQTVHALLREALVFSPDRLGLYEGAAGLMVVLDAVARDPAALANARARLRGLLAASIRESAAADVDDWTTFDLISGIAGRALALRDSEPAALPAFHAYAERLADAVEARLAGPGGGEGVVNLGVAHGVPGVLAALNAMFPQPNALARRYVDLLLATSHEVGGARRWDSFWIEHAVPPPLLSWCYGTIGVAAVLYDRAVLDGDDVLRAAAVRALERVALDDTDDARWSLPSLCHGWAGLAAVIWHAAGESELLQRRAETVAKRVLEQYDERRPLGYRSFNLGDGRGEDRTDFLDGAFGVALFLVDAATAHERPWLPLLGLTPD